ncbi:MAG TPA: ABC transporter permease, partial [Fimbriimonadaceae bacterium]|nr:ABC transporter permease [Fimbriimonadaceae bacterium]
NVSLLGIAAAGVAFVTYSGHFADLSVPAVMALSGIVSVSALRWGLLPAALAGIGAGVGVGVVNGLVIGRLRANPIIWTLVTGAAGSGLIRWAFSNTQAYPRTDTEAGRAFVALFGERIAGVPLTVLILAAMIAAGQILLARTKFGARLKLTGSSYEAARMTGIDTRRIVLAVFMLSAFAASVAGILLASLNRLGAEYIGKGYDFTSVTAVVLGGVTLTGGRGSLFGVLGGVLAIGLIETVLTLNGVGVDWQEVVKGALFILVVGSSAYLARARGRDDA